MTVPGAVDLIAELSVSVPAGARRRRDGDGRQTARAVIDAGAPVCDQSGLPTRRDRGVSGARCAGDAGVFFADRDSGGVGSGRRCREAVSGDGARPVFHQGSARAVPAIKIMPTGGVSVGNAADWIRAGAVAIGVGSALVDSKAVQAGRFDVIAEKRACVRGRGARCALMAKTVCFGEIMLRLSPPGHERLLQTPFFHASFGGGEANVAVSLAQFGHESHYITRLPSNAIGDAAIKVLRAEGVAGRSHPARRRSRRHLLRGDRCEPARVDGGLRPRAFGDQPDAAGQHEVGQRAQRRLVVPLHGYHPGAWRRTRRPAPPRRSTLPGRPARRSASI